METQNYSHLTKKADKKIAMRQLKRLKLALYFWLLLALAFLAWIVY
jgi:hypothetical protein